MKSCILVGDSIRHGYQATVNAELAGWGEFWQPSENGGTSRNVLAHVDEWIINRQPGVVHINCGLHDIARDNGPNKLKRVELDEYERNLREIFTRVRKQTKALLLWARTTPVIESRHNGGRKGFDRLNAEIDAYNAAADAIAAEMKVPVDDLHKVVIDAGAEQLICEDGVHYTDEGKVVLGKAVAAFIRKQAGG